MFLMNVLPSISKHLIRWTKDINVQASAFVSYIGLTVRHFASFWHEMALQVYPIETVYNITTQRTIWRECARMASEVIHTTF